MKTLGATLETRFYPFEGVVRSHARAAREMRRQGEGRETFKHEFSILMFSWQPQDLLASFGLISSYPNPNRNPNHYA